MDANKLGKVALGLVALADNTALLLESVDDSTDDKSKEYITAKIEKLDTTVRAVRERVPDVTRYPTLTLLLVELESVLALVGCPVYEPAWFGRRIAAYIREMDEAAMLREIGDYMNTVEWSKARPPSEWAKVFDISEDTFYRRRTSGQYLTDCISTKRIRVAMKDLPGDYDDSRKRY